MPLNSAPNPKLRTPHYTLRIISLIVLIWISLLLRDGLALKSDWEALQGDLASLSSGTAKLDLASLQVHVASADLNLKALRSDTAPLLIFAPLLSSVPKYGGDIQAASTLLNMATKIAAAADQAISVVAPIWPPKSSGDRSAIEQIAQALSDHQPDLIAARDHIDQAGADRAAIDSSRLSDRFKSLLVKFDQLYPTVRSGADLLSLAPQLLGNDRPRTYLILFQNQDELRATGGFLSAVGRVQLSAGKIVSMTVSDSTFIDDYAHKPYEDVPAPMAQIMGDGLWLFRDANWSPDFPTSARKAAELYDTGKGGGPVDGVIALNQEVVQAIVAGIEPIEISPNAPALTTQNVIEYMRAAWNPTADETVASTWFLSRKEFISRMSQAILDRILRAPDSVHWPTLTRGLIDQLNQHNLLIVLDDPQTAGVLSQSNWNGSLQKSDGDYLMVVDTNLGFNKVNAAVTETIRYAAAIQPDRSIEAELNLVYHNNNPRQAGCVPSIPSYQISVTYESLINMCYWDYLRVLAPPGAQLTAHTPYAIPADKILSGLGTDGSVNVSTELDKKLFGLLLVVERGAALPMTLRYRLPPDLIKRENGAWVYRLAWQKQPGNKAGPIELMVSWPPGWRLLSAAPTPTAVDAQSISIIRNSNADVQIELRFSDQP